MEQVAALLDALSRASRIITTAVSICMLIARFLDDLHTVLEQHVTPSNG